VNGEKKGKRATGVGKVGEKKDPYSFLGRKSLELELLGLDRHGGTLPKKGEGGGGEKYAF